MLFFGYFAQYQSEPNMSDASRRIYYATHNRLSAGEHMAEYCADKHKRFSPDIDRNSEKKYVSHV